MLICPACQSSVDWLGELDQCPVCSSVHLVRRLGEVECRDCGYVREPTGGGEHLTVGGVTHDPSGQVHGVADATPGLAEEVELALARVLGRGRPARIG